MRGCQEPLEWWEVQFLRPCINFEHTGVILDFHWKAKWKGKSFFGYIFFSGSLWIFMHGTMDFHCVMVEPVDQEIWTLGTLGSVHSYISGGERVW